MYARYTEFEFDAADRERVLAVWTEIGSRAHPLSPAGAARRSSSRSDDPGVLRLVTLWDAPEDFERYYAAPDHIGLSEAIKGSGMRGRVRDGLTAHHVATPAGSLVRVTRGSSIRPRPTRSPPGGGPRAGR